MRDATRPPREKQFEFEYRYPAGAFDEAEILRLARQAAPAAKLRWALLVNHVYKAGAAMMRVREIHQRGRATRSLLTLKLPPERAGGFEQEYETGVHDGRAAARIVAALGFRKRHVLEKLRGTLQIPGLGEIALDLNPGLPAALEVEAASKHALDRLVSLLRLGGPPSAAMRDASSLEGQYAAHYGLDGKLLRVQFRGRGRSLLFTDAAPVRELIQGSRKQQFDRLFSAQAETAVALRGP